MTWDAPTRQEIMRWEWLDETCAGCGELRIACVCPPGCDCDPEEE